MPQSYEKHIMEEEDKYDRICREHRQAHWLEVDVDGLCDCEIQCAVVYSCPLNPRVLEDIYDQDG